MSMHTSHPNAPVLGPPKTDISPFIRSARWAALLLGVGWGAMRYSQIRSKHEKRRVVEYEAAELRESAASKEKQLMNQKQMMDLAKEANIVVTSDMRKSLGFDN